MKSSFESNRASFRRTIEFRRIANIRRRAEYLDPNRVSLSNPRRESADYFPLSTNIGTCTFTLQRINDRPAIFTRHINAFTDRFYASVNPVNLESRDRISGVEIAATSRALILVVDECNKGEVNYYNKIDNRETVNR